MRTIIYLFFILFLASCSNDKVATPPPPLEGCDKFKSSADCVAAKEINFTLAYILGSKAETQVISLSKLDGSSPRPFKIKNSEELERIRRQFQEANYSSNSGARVEELVQFIQDDMEGQGSGRKALQVKIDRENAIREAEEKRRAEESEANKKIREKMQKELDMYPVLFEIGCYSNIDDVEIELELCGVKLKPTLKVTSDNKIIYNFTFLDFISETLKKVNFRLPKEFSFELNSTAKDSSKLLAVQMKKRKIEIDPKTGKLVFDTEKPSIIMMGQNLIFVP